MKQLLNIYLVMVNVLLLLINNPKLNFSDDVNDPLPKVVYDSIKSCNEDVQNDLFNNIVLGGGLSMFEGIDEHLGQEIRTLSPSTKNLNVKASPERKYSALWFYPWSTCHITTIGYYS